YYSRQCIDRFGVHNVTMVDKLESENWRTNPKLREGIDFRLGDFSDDGFMSTIRRKHELALAYDVLPHQIDLRRAISLMLSKTSRFFLVSNAILPDKLMPFRNCLILLSGSREQALVPFHEEWTKKTDYWRNFHDPSIVDTEHWLWGISPSFIESLVTGFGWHLLHREFWRGWLPQDSKWRYCGLIFTRTHGERSEEQPST
ncbi:MAG: hypothetical protein ACE5IB_07400, partial [Candidatus Geothermarchaeales archaeon]